MSYNTDLVSSFETPLEHITYRNPDASTHTCHESAEDHQAGGISNGTECVPEAVPEIAEDPYWSPAVHFGKCSGQEWTQAKAEEVCRQNDLSR